MKEWAEKKRYGMTKKKRLRLQHFGETDRSRFAEESAAWFEV